MYRIRQALIDIGAENPHLRPKLRPVIKSAAWERLPKGWTQESVEKFWSTLTGEAKHKVTKCIEKMKGKFDDPGAFCASLADKATGDTSWRGKRAAVPYAALVSKAVVLIKAAQKDRPHGDPKALTTGFIYGLFKFGFRDTTISQALWNLFEHGGPSLDPMAFEPGDVSQFVRHLGSGPDAKIRAAQFSIALLRSTRQPKLADRTETLFAQHLGPLDQVVAPGKRKRPSEVFLATVTPEIQVLAQKVYRQLGTPEAARSFAGDVAEDINWHSSPVGPDGGPTPPGLVGEVSMKLDYNVVPDGAAFMYWLLNLAGRSGDAQEVMRGAMRAFPDVYEDFGKMASRVANAWLQKQLRG